MRIQQPVVVRTTVDHSSKREIPVVDPEQEVRSFVRGVGVREMHCLIFIVVGCTREVTWSTSDYFITPQQDYDRYRHRYVRCTVRHSIHSIPPLIGV